MSGADRDATNRDWRVEYHPKVGGRNTVQVVWVADGANVAYGIEISACAEVMVMEHNRAEKAEANLAALLAERDRLNDQWSDTAGLASEANAENAALRARVEEVERIATNYRESDAKDKEGVYRVGLTVIRDMLRKSLAGGTAAQESAGTWRDLPPETLERARAAKTLERIPVIQDDATHEAMATLEESESAGECGGSYYTVTDHEVSEYPCPSCGRWIAVQIDPVGQGYYLARHDNAQESAGG